jgi:hypothetical protein
MPSIILLLALLQQSPARVEGVVVDAMNGAPLKDVQVLLLVRAESRYRRVVTDSSGAFSFDDVVPGDTLLTILRDGYLGSTLAESVSANVRNSRRVALTLAPSISGRIYDSDRHPAANITVQLFRDGYDALGARTLEPSGSRWAAKTDEKGEYRINGFPPGDFYLRAAYSAEPAKRTIGVPIATVNNAAPTYYPDVTSADQALPIKIAGGAALQAIDFSIEPVAPFKISGRIVNSLVPDPVDRYSFFLVRRDALVRDGANQVPDMDPAIDRFEIRNVPPGAYDLYVGFAMKPNVQIPSVVGKTSVDVVDHNVRDIVVAIEPGIDIAGSWKSDDPAGLKSTERGAIILRPLDGMPETLVPPISLRDDGAVEVQHVPAGRYMLLFRAAQTIYVSVARFGALDVIGKPFDVDPHSDGPLLFDFSKFGGVVEGTVLDSAGKPAAEASVIFLPPIDLRADYFSVKMATADGQGRFVITGIRPGNYTVFAITDKLGLATHLTPYLNYGMHIEVGKGQHIQQDLTLIPRQ